MNNGREGSRHSEEYEKNKVKKALKWEFIGIDGEGSTLEGDSIYQLLAADVRGEMRSIEDQGGLQTVACLEFLLSLAYRKSKLALCGYGFTYDVCNILRDVPWRHLEILAKDETCFYAYPGRVGEIRYKIRVIYKKSLEIWRLERDAETAGKMGGRSKGRWKTTGYARVYDCIGFFQCSFLTAINRFKLVTEEEALLIDQYKQRRGEDLTTDFVGWKKYNALECRLLVRLMEEWNKTLESEGIYLTNWWGAGAIASFWFKERDIKSHVVQSFDSIIPLVGRSGEGSIDRDIMRAYYGGQIQRLMVGLFNHRVYHYDICSAYPWAQSMLPSLRGEWFTTDRFEKSKWALYEVEWDFTPYWNGEFYGALPWRTKSGSILYPIKGWGVYWRPEIEAVMIAYPGTVFIRRGRYFCPDTDSEPFAWIRYLYEKRKEYKLKGDPRSEPLKFGLNSLYGKTVQRKGMKDSRGIESIPPYQSYMWGGLITSMTRARLIEAIGDNPGVVIAAATDGLFSLAPLDLDIGTNLGEWQEEPSLEWFELYANGVYRGLQSDGKILQRARGVEDRAFDFDGFRKALIEKGPEKAWIDGRKRTFFGYKIAVHRGDPSLFCTWGDEVKSFNIIGVDCFKAHRTPISHIYRLECTANKTVEKWRESYKAIANPPYQPEEKPFKVGPGPGEEKRGEEISAAEQP